MSTGPSTTSLPMKKNKQILTNRGRPGKSLFKISKETQTTGRSKGARASSSANGRPSKGMEAIKDGGYG